jgi:ABC-type antimicrobial peptide transport system permease subunit
MDIVNAVINDDPYMKQQYASTQEGYTFTKG